MCEAIEGIKNDYYAIGFAKGLADCYAKGYAEGRTVGG